MRDRTIGVYFFASGSSPEYENYGKFSVRRFMRPARTIAQMISWAFRNTWELTGLGPGAALTEVETLIYRSPNTFDTSYQNGGERFNGLRGMEWKSMLLVVVERSLSPLELRIRWTWVGFVLFNAYKYWMRYTKNSRQVAAIEEKTMRSLGWTFYLIICLKWSQFRGKYRVCPISIGTDFSCWWKERTKPLRNVT